MLSHNYVISRIQEEEDIFHIEGKQALRSSCELLRQGDCQKLSLACISYDKL